MRPLAIDYEREAAPRARGLGSLRFIASPCQPSFLELSAARKYHGARPWKIATRGNTVNGDEATPSSATLSRVNPLLYVTKRVRNSSIVEFFFPCFLCGNSFHFQVENLFDLVCESVLLLGKKTAKEIYN